MAKSIVEVPFWMRPVIDNTIHNKPDHELRGFMAFRDKASSEAFARNVHLLGRRMAFAQWARAVESGNYVRTTTLVDYRHLSQD